MQLYGINGNLLDLIEDCLKCRKHCVKVNGCFYDFIDISVGTPQGTNLGPLLWLFYVNNLGVSGFRMGKHADDITFYDAFTKKEARHLQF